MWKPLFIVSGILLLASAGLNIQVRKQIETQSLLNDAAKKNAADSKAYYGTAQTALEDGKKAATEKKRAADQEARDLTEAKTKREAAEKQMVDEGAKLAEVKKSKTDMDAKMIALGGIDAIVEELNAKTSKKTELEAAIAQREAAHTLAMSKQQASESQIASLKKKDIMQKTGLLPDSFSASITSIDPTWGFIQINKGNSSNVTKNAKLDVKRGGAKIATLVVTNVQPGAAICDVVPGTLAAGAALQPGDSLVVNESSSEKKALAEISAASGSEAPAPGAAPAARTPAVTPSAAPDPFATPAAPAAEPAPAPAADPTPAAPMAETPAN